MVRDFYGKKWGQRKLLTFWLLLANLPFCLIFSRRGEII